MLDSDLADLYGVKTKRLNEQVKRNIERFPSNFMFQLDEEDILRSQIVTSSEEHGGRRYLLYVFTEQGVAMLSAILNSKIAIDVSIKIMNAFIVMRKLISRNSLIFQRMDNIEKKQLIYDQKFDEVFDLLNNKIEKEEGVFFDGQVFDSYVFVCSLIRKARKRIVLIDNYIDERVFEILSKNEYSFTILVYTSKYSKLDLDKYNKQYDRIEIKITDKITDISLKAFNEGTHESFLDPKNKYCINYTKYNIRHAKYYEVISHLLEPFEKLFAQDISTLFTGYFVGNPRSDFQIEAAINGKITVVYVNGKFTEYFRNLVEKVKKEREFVPETIYFKGFEYKTVLSKTGRVWLDRNLGASRVAESYDDPLSYGGYYRNVIGDIDCPEGFRLPTEEEWKAEIEAGDINTSVLKLPMPGRHSFSSGSLINVGSFGYYWSSTVSGSSARYLYFYSSIAYMNSLSWAYGLSVRLIKS